MVTLCDVCFTQRGVCVAQRGACVTQRGVCVTQRGGCVTPCAVFQPMYRLGHLEKQSFFS